MKIYFGFTVEGNRDALDAARRIVEVLVRMGHDVLTAHLVRDDARNVDRRITPQEVYTRDMRWLTECELFIAEVSGSTFGLGFETGLLLAASTKPVILFYQKQREEKISLMIVGNTHPYCTLVPYSEVEELERLVLTSLSSSRWRSPGSSD